MAKLTFRRFLTAVLLAAAAPVALAAQPHNLRQDPEALERLRAGSGNAADPAFRAALGLSAAEGLEAVRTYDDGRGGTVTRYRQHLRGVPVWGEQIVVGRDAAGRVRSLHGRAVRDLAAGLNQLQPSVSGADALTAMKDRVRAGFRGATDLVFSDEEAELVIYVDDGTPRLSQAVSFFADSESGGQPTRPTFIVDALTGEVVFEFEGLTHTHGCNGCTDLTDGDTVTGLSSKRGRWRYFTFDVPSTTASVLDVILSGGSGDADLYVRRGAQPTSSAYDCRPWLNGNNEQCSLSINPGDMWYIGVYGYRNYSGVSLLARTKTLSTQDGTGPGGNLKTGQYEYDGTNQNGNFGHLAVVGDGTTCTMDNANVKTVDLNHGSSGATAYSYGCSRNTHKQINGAFSPLNDAHYFGGVVYDMYDAYLNVAPLTFQLTMRVHYGDNYENAFWNGSSMTFGDGYTTFYPLVSLDVSAHEVSHGFTEQNSDLTYSGQSGGINEAFSDIAGEAAEYFMRGDNDFLVGAEIYKATGKALRYMCDPPLDGRSIGHVDDYSSGLDVHYSSGVFNKAFCLLAKTTEWTTRTAFQAFARANQLYWTQSTNFEEGANGVLDAAADLGLDPQDVADAFAAVGINLAVSTTTTSNPPAAPSNLIATALSASEISLSWADNADNEDGFEIQRSPDGANGWEVVATPSANAESDTDADLAPGTAYWYRVRATSATEGSSAYSDIATATTGAEPPPPPPPTGITLSANGFKVKGVQHAELTWEGASNVNVLRDNQLVANSTGSSYTDNIGNKGGGSYVYQVCGSDGTCSDTVTVVF